MTNIYALPNSTHFERGITGVIEYANTTSDGLFILLFLAVLWFITFIGTLGGTRLNASSAFLTSMFLIMVVSVPLAVLGLLGAKWMYLIGFMFALSIFLKAIDKEGAV